MTQKLRHFQKKLTNNHILDTNNKIFDTKLISTKVEFNTLLTEVDKFKKMLLIITKIDCTRYLMFSSMFLDMQFIGKTVLVQGVEKIFIRGVV